jgi:hypothetical protein
MGGSKMKVKKVDVFEFDHHHLILGKSNILNHRIKDNVIEFEYEHDVFNICPGNYKVPDDGIDYIGVILYFYPDHIEYRSSGSGFSPIELSADLSEVTPFIAHLLKQEAFKECLDSLVCDIVYGFYPKLTQELRQKIPTILNLINADNISIKPTDEEQRLANNIRLEKLFK